MHTDVHTYRKTCRHTDVEINKHRDRHANKPGRQTETETETGERDRHRHGHRHRHRHRQRQTDYEMHTPDRQISRHACIYLCFMYAWMDGRWLGWLAGWLAGWLVGGWMDGWMDICVKEHACMHALCLCLCRHARRQNISTQAMQCSVVQNVRQCYVLFRTVQL